MIDRLYWVIVIGAAAMAVLATLLVVALVF